MSVVALVREPSPDRKVRELTERLLSHFRRPAWKSDRPVLLKVNCLCRSKPEEGYDVHPEVVLAVARRFRDWGYEVIIGDNEGRKILESTGVAQLADREGFPMHDTVSDLVEMPVPDALLFDRLLVSKLALESRRVSVAKFKTHVETILTFSLKNMKGCIGGQRQGDAESLRVEFHLRGLNQALVDVNKLLRPDFALVEGLAAMEGIGPGRWISHMRHDAGVLAGGFDPVAVDAVCCAIAGTEPSQIKHVMLAAEAGLGTADLAGIRLVGTPLREARIPDFVLPTGNVAEMSPDPNLLITNGGACSHCISALTGALAMVKKETLRQGLRSPLEVVMGKEARPKRDPSRRITLGRCARHLVGPGTEEVTGCPATASYIVRALEAIARREESQAAGGR